MILVRLSQCSAYTNSQRKWDRCQGMYGLLSGCESRTELSMYRSEAHKLRMVLHSKRMKAVVSMAGLADRSRLMTRASADAAVVKMRPACEERL